MLILTQLMLVEHVLTLARALGLLQNGWRLVLAVMLLSALKSPSFQSVAADLLQQHNAHVDFCIFTVP